MAWERLGQLAPRDLRSAREQAHWAAQVIAAAGETFCAHEADTSHTSMAWDAALAGLVGRALPAAPACRVGLRLRDLSLCLLTPDGASPVELALAGRTLAEAYRWASEAIRAATRGALERSLVHPGFELPEHALAHGGRFAIEPGLAELARWYANADALLRRLAQENRGAGPVRCWPHHFDIAALIEVDPRGVAAPWAPALAGRRVDRRALPVREPSPVTSRRELPPLAAGE